MVFILVNKFVEIHHLANIERSGRIDPPVN